MSGMTFKIIELN